MEYILKFADGHDKISDCFSILANNETIIVV